MERKGNRTTTCRSRQDHRGRYALGMGGVEGSVFARRMGIGKVNDNS